MRDDDDRPAGPPTLFLCDCLGGQRIDPGSAATACAATAAAPSQHLCRRQIDRVATALEAGGDVIVACGQEADAFAALADELGVADRLSCIDIRDRAGWTDDTRPVAPKQAALLAEAAVAARPTPALTLRAEGACLILGEAEVALQAAALASDRLAITVLTPSPEPVIAPLDTPVQLTTGRVAQAKGWLGAFGVRIDAFAQAEPAGRGPTTFGPPRDGAQTECDLIVDLSGAAPLFPAHDKRDGYIRADPRDPAAVARAMLTATGLVGEFEKPLYINFDAALCAHSRSGQPGCTRCLDVCPTAAIVPDGETVRIDPNICAGCGACAAVCPSGAASYDYADDNSVWRRLDALLRGWREAGGPDRVGPLRLMIHDAAGAEMIAASARFGRGLPADVAPFALNQITQADHALMLAALAAGAAEVIAHLHPRKADEAAALRAQAALAQAMAAGAGLAGDRIAVVETDDPDALEAALWRDSAPAHGATPITPLGGRRAVARQAMATLGAATGAMAEVIDLPVDLFPMGPPYGAVTVDTDACTLCLACVSVCPAGALLDNPDRPELRFLEDSCLQCGVCRNACPETAITLTPRYLTTPAAKAPQTLHSEPPFECVECGKPFGTRSVVERIAEKLVGQHWMFSDDSRARLIQMCDDCRVRAQYHTQNNPFRMGDRPRPRTTDDDLAERAARDGGPKPPNLKPH